MPEEHPITPPPQLVHQWHKEACKDPYHGGTFFESKTLKHISTQAARWGSDQQLELDAKWLDHNALNEAHLKVVPMGEVLKEAMRPKPPSLKEQALARVARIPGEGADAAYLRHWVDNESQRLVDLLHEVFKSLPS